MQGTSLLTVKQVAAALGIDERSVRDKLMLGTLKGTKKTIGQKDQWFVHQRDLDAELARRGLSPLNQARANAAEATPMLAAVVPPASGAWAPPQSDRETSVVVSEPPTVVEPIQSYAPDAETEPDDVIAEVTEPSHSAEKSAESQRLVWRNKDLEKKMQETAEAFVRPLIEKVEALTREGMEKDRVIEEQKQQLLLLPDLESQKARLLRDLEAERKAAEIQFAKANEKEEQAIALEAENEKLKQKAEEATLSAAKLEQLEREILQLKQPKPSWWSKLFMPASGQES